MKKDGLAIGDQILAVSPKAIADTGTVSFVMMLDQYKENAESRQLGLVRNGNREKEGFVRDALQGSPVRVDSKALSR